MNLRGFILSLVALISISGLVTTQGGDEDSKTTIVKPSNQPYYMESGTKLELECHYTDTDAGSGVSISWYKDDMELSGTDAGEFYATNKLKEDILVSTLRKPSVDLEDTATYKCRKQGAEPSKGYNLPVYVFTILPQDVVAEPKQDLELQCLVEGELYDGSMTWSVDGAPIVTDDTKYKTNDVNNTLVIYNIVKDDIKNYTCGFTVSGQTFSAVLRVESKPHVVDFTKSKNLVQGDPLTLTCDTWGIPLPTVTWLKREEDGEDLPIEDDGRVTYEDSDDGIVNATLRIQNLDFDDRADYTCVATNVNGNSSSTILVRVKDKLAALWPFLGICVEVAILCIIIFIYEKRRAKKMEEEEQQEEAGHLTNSNDHKGKDEIRHRK